MRTHGTLSLAFCLTLGLAACRAAPEGSASTAAFAPARTDDVSLAEADLLAAMRERATRLGAGIRAFAQGDDRATARHAEAVLAAEPDNVKARELAAAAARGGQGAQRVREQRMLSAWLADFEAGDPDDRALKWPSVSFWKRLSAARSRGG